MFLAAWPIAGVGAGVGWSAGFDYTPWWMPHLKFEKCFQDKHT